MTTKITIHGLTINVGAPEVRESGLPTFLGALSFAGLADVSTASQGKVLSDDGLTVRDAATRLTWQQAGSASKMRNDGPAEEYVAKLNAEKFGGIDTWRLPDDMELSTLPDRARRKPSIDPVFACEADYYWTNKPYIESDGSSSVYAWIVHFAFGDVDGHGRGSDAFVRAVSGPAPAGQ
jgi:hypothetical protein